MKRVIIIIVVVVVIVVGIIGFRAFSQQRSFFAQMEDLQTVSAEFGSLVATVGSTGTVRANQIANLVWQVSGTVEEVNVVVGQEVGEGDLLARLMQTSLPQNVILAQAELVSAEKALEDLFEAYDDLALAQAQKAIADARDAVYDAEIRLNGLKLPADQQDINAAYARLVLAENQLKMAKNMFNRYKNKPKNNLKRASAQLAFNQAQDAYDAALRTYNSLTGTASDINIAIGEADLLVAQELLAQADADYETLLGGTVPDDVAAAEARIAAAQATLSLAWIEVPFGGIITMVEPLPGDKVGAGTPAFRLDDLSRLLVDVEISEVDINRVEVGQDVFLSFDAILDREYNGKVIEVAPVGISQQGIVNFLVRIILLDPDELVKPGMTAAVNIVVIQLENIMLVPNRAVRVVDGQRVVYILVDEDFEKIEISLGASSDTHSEILDGDLKPGDLIVLNPPLFFIEQHGSPGGGMFGGGMGGMP
jgi:HlyD family secretion protein